jgi:hypothetical protein
MKSMHGMFELIVMYFFLSCDSFLTLLITYDVMSNRRWEIFHGQLSESGSKWDGTSNPRKPGTYSLENLRFIVTDTMITNLGQVKDSTDAMFVYHMKTLAHILSPNRCGIYDELIALIQMKVILVEPNGIPKLTKDWWSAVDVLLLDDMWNRWGVQTDVNSNYGVHSKIRKTLSRKWFRSEDGWALQPNRNDIIFEFDEFDEWRVAYEAKQQTASDGLEGIGRFR